MNRPVLGVSESDESDDLGLPDTGFLTEYSRINVERRPEHHGNRLGNRQKVRKAAELSLLHTFAVKRAESPFVTF